MARYRPLFLVIALLALPFVVAATLYLTGWRPAKAGNHGELLDPPRPSCPRATRLRWRRPSR